MEDVNRLIRQYQTILRPGYSIHVEYNGFTETWSGWVECKYNSGHDFFNVNNDLEEVLKDVTNAYRRYWGK